MPQRLTGLSGMNTINEATALAWYEFIRERLDDDLRAAYPTTDSTPAMDDYREKFRGAQAEYQDLMDALHRGDRASAEDCLWALRNRASGWKTHPEYPEPISDGTLPRPGPGDRPPLREADPQGLGRGRGPRRRSLLASPKGGRSPGTWRALRPDQAPVRSTHEVAHARRLHARLLEVD